MKILGIKFTFFVLPVKRLGQIDYLTPCPDLEKIIPEIKVYELDLYKVLLKNFNDKPIARYVVLHHGAMNMHFKSNRTQMIIIF